MPIQPEKWEIWLAPFKYEDSEETKIRPVLIYENMVVWFISFKITTHAPRLYCGAEYVVRDWEGAGLKYPSVIRCTKKAVIRQSDLIRKIGKLSMRDIRGVAQILNVHYNEE